MPWCSGVCSYGTSSSEGWRKKNVVKSTVSLNLIEEFTSLFSPKVIVAGLPRKAFPPKQAFVDISVFLWLRKQQPRFAQGQPKGYFQMKEIDIHEGRRKLNANMRQYVLFRGNMDQHRSCQLCRERQPFWNSHDGLNLTCLDQCHGVGSAPPKAGAKKGCTVYSPNLIHEDTSLFSPKVTVAGLPRKAFPRKPAFVDISVFLWLRKQQPRQPKGYFQTKELDRTTEAFARMNVVWEGGEVS